MKKKICCFLLLMVIKMLLSGCGQLQNTENTRDFVKGEEVQAVLLTMKGLEEMSERVNAFAETQEVSFEQTGHDTYGYDSLDEAEKLWYQDMNAAFSVRSEEPVSLSEQGFKKGLTHEDVDRIYQCVLIDHPEYFYVEGYEYTVYSAQGKTVGIRLWGTYSFDRKECLRRKALIEAETECILQGAPSEGSDYDKIKYVYETIIYQTDYCMDAADNQNIYSVFVGHASVCQGYAKAAQYLLNRLGIACTLVFGEVEDAKGHVWNLVKADGDYYYLDTTWGDVSCKAGDTYGPETEMPIIDYDYLCITTEQLLRTHRIVQDLPLPVCTQRKDNYYVKEGCYFTAYDEEQLKREFEEAFRKEPYPVALKCDNTETYELMCRKLLEEQHVFDYLDNSCETIAYIESKEQLSLTFWVTK